MVGLDLLHFPGRGEGQGSPPRSAQRLIAPIALDVHGESSDGWTEMRRREFRWGYANKWSMVHSACYPGPWWRILRKIS